MKTGAERMTGHCNRYMESINEEWGGENMESINEDWGGENDLAL